MRYASSNDTARTDFDAAFPWFDHARWMWSFDSEDKSGPAYARLNAPSNAKGVLAVHLAGRGYERYRAVIRWLIARFNPLYIVPLPPQFPKWTGERQGGHNSETFKR